MLSRLQSEKRAQVPTDIVYAKLKSMVLGASLAAEMAEKKKFGCSKSDLGANGKLEIWKHVFGIRSWKCGKALEMLSIEVHERFRGEEGGQLLRLASQRGARRRPCPFHPSKLEPLSIFPA